MRWMTYYHRQYGTHLQRFFIWRYEQRLKYKLNRDFVKSETLRVRKYSDSQIYRPAVISVLLELKITGCQLKTVKKPKYDLDTACWTISGALQTTTHTNPHTHTQSTGSQSRSIVFHGTEWLTSLSTCVTKRSQRLVQSSSAAGVMESGRVDHNLWMKMNSHKLHQGCVMTHGRHFVFLHTSVWEMPCLRKTQAGPTICSMLQFFNSAPKGSVNSSSSASWSSSSCSCRSFWHTGLTLSRRDPSISLFRGRPGC